MSASQVFFTLGNETICLQTTVYGGTGIVYINLHENEQTAVETAKQVLPHTCGILIEIKHTAERLISFHLNDHTYIFDPNRMFSATGIKNSLLENGIYDEDAEHLVAAFADAVTQQLLSHQPELIVALHNTTGDYSMANYEEGGELANDMADMFVNNEHNKADFFFTINRSYFEQIKQAGYNVLLQDNEKVTDDGSLSVYCAQHGLSYINTEALNEHLQEQVEMVRFVASSIVIWCMNIREYQPSDREPCITIFDSNTPQYFDPTEKEYLQNWLTGKDEGRHSYKNNIAEHFYVLEHDGAVVGCGGFYIPEAKPVANMVWGMIHRDYHKHGLGKALFQYRVQQIQKLYPHCSIILDTTQHTYGFFEKLGFKVTQITNDAYGPGLNRYDMVMDAK
ncbi:MAG: GNAT family N-acetyltransferase [Bacteroidetes bacterium]|nr:GNAT family N-acetyltransferase [Bacteroidota bacterium]